MHFKNLLVLMSYVNIIILVIISYNAIIPEDEIPVFENEEKLIKKIENNFKPNKDSVYGIIENKKSLNSTELKTKETDNSKKSTSNGKSRENEIFRVQVASFKKEKKSKEISKKLNKKFSDNIEDFKLTVKKIIFGNNDIFFRVVSEKLYDENKASSICKKIINKKNQCILVRDNF